MGSLVVPKVAAFWKTTVLAEQIERGLESKYMTNVTFIHDIFPQVYYFDTIVLHIILFLIAKAGIFSRWRETVVNKGPLVQFYVMFGPGISDGLLGGFYGGFQS